MYCFTLSAYGYGTLAVFIVCLCSLAAILFIPFANTVCLRTFDYVLGVFLGLAVGTLIADAILHLFPAVSCQEIILLLLAICQVAHFCFFLLFKFLLCQSLYNYLYVF